MNQKKLRSVKYCFIAIAAVLLAFGILYIFRFGAEGTVYFPLKAEGTLTYSLAPEDDAEPFLEIASVEQTKGGILVHISATSVGSGPYIFSYGSDNGGGMEFFRASCDGSGILWFDHIPQGSDVLSVCGMILTLMLLIYLMLKFHTWEKVTPYSYRLVSLGGAILFSAFCLGTQIALTVRCLSSGSPLTIDAIAYQLLDAPKALNRILFPILILIFAAMSLSNIVLIRKEGVRPKNVLGAAVCAFLMVLTLVAICLQGRLYDGLGGYSASFGLQLFWDTALCYLECIILSIVIYGLKSANYKPKSIFDYIIIPGCKIAPDGHLYPLLRNRVDRAVRLAAEQEKRFGSKATLVPSGGKGSDEILSEAAAMQKYLIDTGFPPERILSEDRSENTYQNMVFSKRLIDERTPDARVAFSTTNYHVLRSGIYAGEAGLNALGVGSRTAWYYWPNAFVRELVALLVNRKKQHIGVLIALVSMSAVTAAVMYLVLM